MSNLLKNYELTFALVIRNYDLSLSHAKFMQSSGIVPSSWTLNRQPVANDLVSQVVYSNGVTIVGEPNRCLFAETLEDKTPEACASPQVIQNYIDKLPNLGYHAVGINFRSYLQLGLEGLESYQDFYDKILVPGSWQQHENKPVQTELKLVYDFDSKSCIFTINEGKLRQAESEALPVIIFSSNFTYELSNYSDEERIDKLKKIIIDWHQDFETFQKIINDFYQMNQDKLLVSIG